jgi:hypothetical protein
MLFQTRFRPVQKEHPVDAIGARPDIKNGAINLYVGTGKIEKSVISNMILYEKGGKP